MTEVTGPIIATTAVLMAVFVPVAFIPGVAGRLYNQFALTVAISVGISAFNSLTLSPALGRRVAASSAEADEFFAVPLVQRRLRARCRMPMRAAVRVLIALRLGAARRFRRHRWRRPTRCRGRLASTFLPVEDQGYFFVVIQLPDGASLERTDAVAKQVRDILQATPGVDIVGSISGLNFLTNAAQSNSAVEFAVLKPWDERGRRNRAPRRSSPRCGRSCSPFPTPSR